VELPQSVSILLQELIYYDFSLISLMKNPCKDICKFSKINKYCKICGLLKKEQKKWKKFKKEKKKKIILELDERIISANS